MGRTTTAGLRSVRSRSRPSAVSRFETSGSSNRNDDTSIPDAFVEVRSIAVELELIS
jgi:hypothetical protein